MASPPARPLISVIIPAYERQEQLPNAVQSVTAQRGLGDAFDVELIVVDDASPTPQGTQLSAPGVSLRVERHGINQGPAAARNTGIALATGDYVAFLDSDDTWRAEKLALQVEEAAELPADALWALATGFHIKRSRTRRWEDLIPVDMSTPTDFLKGCRHSPGSTSFLPRHVFDRIGPLDASLERLEDYEWYARFGKAGGKLYSLPYILADIDPSNSVAMDNVLTAIERIDAKLTRSGLKPEETALMRAYLNFERGATLMRAESRLAGAFALFRSFLLAPRTNLHLAPITSKPASS